MEFATACSAQVIQQVGAAAGLKSFQQVLDFIAQAPKLTIQRV